MTEDLQLKATVRRINNGYIVTYTPDPDEGQIEVYWPTMESFFLAQTQDAMKDIDKFFRHHNADGTQFSISAKSDLFDDVKSGI